MNKIDRDTIRDVILCLAETSRDDALTIWDLLDAYIQLDHEIELKTAKTAPVTRTDPGQTAGHRLTLPTLPPLASVIGNLR